MTICKGCLGLDPTHTCSAYDPREVERGVSLVLRLAGNREVGERWWYTEGGCSAHAVLSVHPRGAYEVFEGARSRGVDRNMARIVLRGLLHARLMKLAREAGYQQGFREAAERTGLYGEFLKDCISCKHLIKSDDEPLCDDCYDASKKEKF